MSHTHQLAVTAYIIRNGKFLLLKRTTPPLIWGLPGGRLNPDENPNEGIIREIMEETGLSVFVIAPVDIWFGDFGRGLFVSIDYLAVYQSGEVVLSEEHSEFCWSAIDSLRHDNPPLEKDRPFFNLSDFEKAWSLYKKFFPN